MKLVAVLGLIGSGKSTVCDILKSLGATVLSADAENALLLEDASYINSLSLLFPQCVSDGVINKKALRKIIFDNPDARKAINKLAHPLIKERLMEKAKGSLVFVELSVYVKDFLSFDYCWVVTCTQSQNIARAAKRDSLSEASILSVSNTQSLPNKDDKTIYVNNDGSIEQLEKRVSRLYYKLLESVTPQ